MTLTHIEASQRVLTFAREGRLIQGSWHRDAEDGRHLACLLGAMSNGVTIDAPEKCPATIMPEWMAHLVVGLFDGQETDTANAWGVRFGTQMGHAKWPAINWERVRIEFLIGTMTQALEAARAVCEKADYWAAVEGAHRQVREALRGNGDLSAAESAAWSAAWSAAKSAESARSAAWSAAESAAWSAAKSAKSAESAESAAWSAAESAAWSAAKSAESARSAAATRLCDLIDEELSK